MSQLAAEYNAINLSQGFPNFPVDERLKYCCKLAKENVHQYTPMSGYVPYYQKIATLVKTPTEEPFSLKRNY
jgi:methionine aminotransferase